MSRGIGVGVLAAVLIAGGLAAPASAAPATPYHVPFPCGETWTGATRAGHSPSVKSVDWNRNPDLGAPVVAAAAGVVRTAQPESRGGYGRLVVIDHGHDESSLYAHLDTVAVVAGQRIDQGSLIGTVGNSGNSRGSHLHYEQQHDGDVVNAWFAGQRFRYGSATSRNCVDVPLAGNFTGDAAAEVVVFRRARRAKFLVNVPGARRIAVRFGKPFDEPVLGDWNGDGTLDVGVRKPKRSLFKLRSAAGVQKVAFGVPSDLPVTGDWDGDGRTDVGVRRSSDGTFLTRTADGIATTTWLGDGDDLPVTGDWDGDGRTDLGVYDQATATFTLRLVDAAGASWLHVQQFGTVGDLPVTADWDGNGVTDLGVWSPATGTFSQALSTAPTVGRYAVRTVRFGRVRR